MERVKQSIPSPCLVKKGLGRVVSVLCERDFIVVNLGAICEGIIMYVCMWSYCEESADPDGESQEESITYPKFISTLLHEKVLYLRTYLNERVSY